MKHCKEHLPELVTGQLLGLDYDATLEVTNCFPFPSARPEVEGEEYEANEDAQTAYQFDMLRALR